MTQLEFLEEELKAAMEFLRVAKDDAGISFAQSHIDTLFTMIADQQIKEAKTAKQAAKQALVLTPEETQAKWDSGNDRRAAILAKRAK